MRDIKSIYLNISASTCHRIMIFVPKSIYCRVTNSLGALLNLYLSRPSWNLRWPPWNLCFHLPFPQNHYENCVLWAGGVIPKCAGNQLRISSTDEQNYLSSRNNISGKIWGHQVHFKEWFQIWQNFSIFLFSRISDDIYIHDVGV